MTRQMEYSFEDQLKSIISSCGNDIDINMINRKTDLVKDFGFSSLNMVQLVVKMEEEFNIIIEDDYLLIEKLSPYESLLKLLKYHIEKTIPQILNDAE